MYSNERKMHSTIEFKTKKNYWNKIKKVETELTKPLLITVIIDNNEFWLLGATVHIDHFMFEKITTQFDFILHKKFSIDFVQKKTLIWIHA